MTAEILDGRCSDMGRRISGRTLRQQAQKTLGGLP
jgi:hypothetical protein